MAFELQIIEWLQQFSNGFWNAFFSFWTMFGEEEIIIGIMGFIYWCYNKEAGEYIGVSVFISLLLNSVIKVVVQRPRPFLVDSNIVNLRDTTSSGYSFPSGHTQGATSVFGSVAVWMKKKWITISTIVIVIMVALSRMYLGVHYLTDVLVGGALGIGISFLVYHLYKKNNNHLKMYLGILIGCAVLMVGVYFLELFSQNSDLVMTDAQFFYDKVEGTFKMFGAFLGFVIGVQFEKKKVGFDNHKVIWKNLLRFALGVAIVMGARLGLKWVFTQIIDSEALQNGQFLLASIAVLFDLIRYFAMVFVGIGLYPLLFKKLKF